MQGGGELARPFDQQRRVRIGGDDQGRRIGDRLVEVLQRRKADDGLEGLGIGGRITDLRGQLGAPVVLADAERIEQRQFGHHGGEEIRPLGEAGADQHAAIADAADGERALAGQSVTEEIFSGGAEVIEGDLLVRPLGVPGFPALAAAANIGQHIDPAHRCPPDDVQGELRGDGHARAAVAVKQARRPAIGGCGLQRDDAGGDQGSIEARIFDLADLDVLEPRRMTAGRRRCQAACHEIVDPGGGRLREAPQIDQQTAAVRQADGAVAVPAVAGQRDGWRRRQFTQPLSGKIVLDHAVGGVFDVGQVEAPAEEDRSF